MHLDRRKCCCESRVGITVNQDPIRIHLPEYFFEPSQHRPCLSTMRSRSNLKIEIRCGYAEVSEKNVRHQFIIVLTRVGDEMLSFSFHGRCYWSQLHKLRPGTDHTKNTHGPSLSDRRLDSSGSSVDYMAAEECGEQTLLPKSYSEDVQAPGRSVSVLAKQSVGVPSASSLPRGAEVPEIDWSA
ncbi:hypothetical protein GCM10009672_16460 [Nesterenkonia lutea]